MPKSEKDADKNKDKDKKPTNESTGISISGKKVSAFDRNGGKYMTPIGTITLSHENKVDSTGIHIGGKLQIGEKSIGRNTKLNGVAAEFSGGFGPKGIEASAGASIASISTSGSTKIPLGSGTLEIGGKAEIGIGIKYGVKGKYSGTGGSLEAKATIPVPILATPIIVPVTVKIGASINYYPHPKRIDTPTQARAEQKEKALVSLTRDRMHECSLNSFAPRSDFFSTYTSYTSPFSIRPYSYFSPSGSLSGYSSPYMRSDFSRYYDKKIAVEQAIRDQMLRLNPSAISAYLSASSQLGAGYALSYSEFRSIAAATNLIGSYNTFNPLASLRDVGNFAREIGGIGSEVSIISDLKNSETHADAEGYYFCFPEEDFPFSFDLIKQIQHELAEAYFEHKTTPFFSLHFNEGALYPVIHPAFQGTITGKVISTLDYFLKCYLNGGTYDETFLQKWHEIANHDEEFLRKNLIDLKKYVKEHCPGLHYFSLRELENRYDLKQKTSQNYRQPFMSSFRIIAYQEKMERYGNMIIPHPSFRVEYSIDLMPDYENYLESYYKEHGQYPEEYQQIKYAYEQMAEEIKEKLPQLPFCKELFRLLGVMNTFCYFYATLNQMGKSPVLDPEFTKHDHQVPKEFPPIPVRYYRTYDMKLTLGDVLQELFKIPNKQQITDGIVLNVFAQKRINSLPVSLRGDIYQAVLALVNTKLKELLPPNEAYEIHEEEIDRISALVNQFLAQQVAQVHGSIHHQLNRMIATFNLTASNKITHLQTKALPEKIELLKQNINARYNEVKVRWQAHPEVVKQEILRELPGELHEQIGDSFQKIEDAITRELDQLVSKSREKMMVEAIATMEASIKEQFESEKKEASVDIERISAIKLEQEQQVNQGLQAIAQLQQHKANQINSIPGHLRTLNQANIDQFSTSIDNQISQINQGITEITANINKIKEVLAKINQDILESPQKLASVIETKKNEIIQRTQSAELTQLIKDSYKDETQQARRTAILEEGIRILTLVNEQDQKRLDHYKKQIEAFTHVLLSAPKALAYSVNKKYTHTLLGFTGKDLSQQTGDNFRIVGGCGMSLPNLKSEPIAHADQFSQVLAGAVTQTEGETTQFDFNGSSYVAFSVPVINRLEKSLFEEHRYEVTAEDQALAELASLYATEEATELRSPDLANTVIDSSGATFAHYAASVLHENHFAQFISSHVNTRDTLGQLPIHFAAKAGQVGVIEKIIAQDKSQLEKITLRGATPLIIATESGKKEAVKTLLALGANPNHQLPNELFPLYLALQNNFADLAMYLINHGHQLELDKTLRNGMTSLHLAIEGDLDAVAMQLIQKGGSIHIRREADGYTALHCAVKKGKLGLVQAMLPKTSITIELESKKTLLHIAAEAGQLEVVNYLITQGAVIDAKTIANETPLTLAIKAGHLAVAQALARVATLNTLNQNNQTASSLAMQYGMPTVSDILIARGENPEIKDRYGHNYLYYLVRDGDYQRFQQLMDSQSIDLNQCFDGVPLIEIAAQYGRFLWVYDLLERTSEFKKSKQGLQLIHYAVMADEVGFLLEWLETHGPQEGIVQKKSLAHFAAGKGSLRSLVHLLPQLVNPDLEICQLLNVAISHNQVAAAEKIIDYCHDINSVLDNKNNTALHLAVGIGSRDAVELLISRGSNVLLCNSEGQTPFHIALLQDDVYLLKRLLKLSRPAQWPADLWQLSDKKHSASMMRLLEKHRHRVPPLSIEDRNNAPSPSTSHGPIPLLMREEVEELEQCIDAEAFDAVVELLEKNAALVDLFKSSEGGKWLQRIFSRIHDYSSLYESQDEFHLFSSPDRLLTLLDKSGVKPADYLGSKNILLAMITAQTDEEACYRLSVFAKFFPKSIAVLSQDQFTPKIRIAELALKRKRPQLFAMLDELGMQDISIANPGFCGLHEAVRSDYYDSVQHCLKRYAANSVNHKKQTALMFAVQNDNLPIVELLLKHGALPEQTDIEGLHALHYAIRAKSMDSALCILPLLKYPNQANRRGITPLMLAAAHGMLPLVRYLCEKGNHTQQADDSGLNALHYAAIAGQTETIAYLVQHGFVVDQTEAPLRQSKMKHCKKRTPLHLAALSGHSCAVSKLLALGANPETGDSQNNTLCEYAVLSKNTEMLQFVQQLPFYHQKEHNIRLLHAAAVADNLEVLNELILDDVELSSIDRVGNTVLHKAAIYNAVSVTEMLVQGSKELLNLVNYEGDTALHLAAFYGHVSIIEHLAFAEANINQGDSKQRTPIFIACTQGNLGAVAALLNYGADYTLCDIQGITPAQIALANGHVEIACKLVLVGDKSLEEDALAILQPGIREKIETSYGKLNEMLLSPSRTGVGEALARHGFYRVNSGSTEQNSLSHPTNSPRL
jgi:ankyrin repeat protein